MSRYEETMSARLRVMAEGVAELVAHLDDSEDQLLVWCSAIALRIREAKVLRGDREFLYVAELLNHVAVDFLALLENEATSRNLLVASLTGVSGESDELYRALRAVFYHSEAAGLLSELYVWSDDRTMLDGREELDVLDELAGEYGVHFSVSLRAFFEIGSILSGLEALDPSLRVVTRGLAAYAEKVARGEAIGYKDMVAAIGATVTRAQCATRREIVMSGVDNG